MSEHIYKTAESCFPEALILAQVAMIMARTDGRNKTTREDYVVAEQYILLSLLDTSSELRDNYILAGRPSASEFSFNPYLVA